MPTFSFTAPDGTTHSIEGPEGATREQAFQMLRLKQGGQPAPAAPEGPKPTNPNAGVMEDVGAGITAGNAQGAARALGFPGDMATLAHDIAPQGLIDKVKAIPGAKFLYDHLPSTKAVLELAKKTRAATDGGPSPSVPLDYVPNSTAGQLAHTGVSNATTGLMLGAGVPGAVGMGVGGAAGQQIGGETGEAIGSLAGGIGAPLAMARYGRQAMRPLQDAAAVKAEANAGYADPLIRDTRIAPQAAQNIAGDMDAAINSARSRFAPAQAPQVHAAIENLGRSGAPHSGVGPPAPVSIEDIHSLRKTLGTIGQETRDFRPTEQATAAGAAKRVLDRYLDNIPSRDVTSGNPIDAVTALRTANRNWGAQSNATKVGNLIDNAIVTNEGAHSAMNLGNKIRQSFRPLLRNDAAQLRRMGYGDDVIGAVRDVNRGDGLTNTLRYASNALGGGGGIGSLAIGHMLSAATAGTLGYKEGGWMGGLAGTALGMIPGQALRMAANSRTLRHARRVQEELLSRAPANAGIMAANRAARAANAAHRGRAARSGVVAADIALARRNDR